MDQKYQNHFITMAEAGFIAVNQADEDSAVKLFKAASLLRPEEVLPQVGFGYLHLCKLELKKAAEIFSGILEKHPESEMAKTFLGLCYSLNPTEVSKGEVLLSDSAASAKDPTIKTLAVSALDFVEKFVKKSPTPVQAPVQSSAKPL